ncbi:MAG: DUF4118 domain-containing protein [Oscillospiraceae bacterium]
MKQAVKDLGLTLAIMAAAAAVCFVLNYVTREDTFAASVFLLGVVFTARFTNGYLYGILASLIGTFLSNWAFTEPYYLLNDSIFKYPVSFVISSCASLMMSMLMTRMRRESELKSIAEREKLRADLLCSVSHDVRTPVTTIAGSAAAYLDNRDVLPEETKTKLIEDIRDEAQWLARVFENILTVTRLYSGTGELNKRPEAAEEVIGEVVMDFHRSHPDIRVNTDVPGELLMVPMDVPLIRQVIKNILENAAIHGQNVTEINIKLSGDGDNVRFSFEDNGCGFSSDDLGHIFDGMIFSPEIKVTDGRRCMGIGLSLCRSVVNLHGGKMSAGNGERGARLEFVLPMK